MSRRLKLVLAGVLALLVVTGTLGYLLYPKLAVWALRTRVLPRVEARLGRPLRIGNVEIDWGRARLEQVTVAGRDGEPPLVSVERITASFDPWSLRSDEIRIHEVVVAGAHVALRRKPDGSNNWADLAERLRRRGNGEPATGGRRMRIGAVVVEQAQVGLVDERGGLRAAIGRIDGRAVPGGALTLTLAQLSASSRLGPRLGADKVEVAANLADPRGTLAATLAGGSVTPWAKMALTGIAGQVRAESAERLRIDLAGGYGGVDEKLWTAAGWVTPALDGGALELRADRFTLDKLEPILAGTPIQDPAKASIDVRVDLALAGDRLSFSGAGSLAGLTLFHPWLAAEPVREVGFSGELSGHYDRKARLLQLDQLEVTLRRARGRLSGSLALPGGEDAGVPRRLARVDAHVVLPELPCQELLDALPRELTPALQGLRLKGSVTGDIHFAIDWADLDNLVLGGSFDPWRCKALEGPPDARPERLMGEFEHIVEVEEGNFTSFVVGPSNPDFVPYEQISPYLLKSLVTTEDASFHRHRGFITREFRSALLKNLKEGYFKYGASSITMQLVKNVLLYREKTLSRKLQELVLAWYIETVLPKERLLEIYVNVIEFGPGIYGIGPAARHYFGKPAAQLSPLESAFFSSILPNPKQRYLQYCEGTLSRWGDAKVQRIVQLMHKRGLIDDEELATASSSPLAFDRTEALPPDECKKKVRAMLKKTRPTHPPRRSGG